MAETSGLPLAAPIFERVCLIGLGLIGSSIARAARHKGLARTIVASDASADVRRRVAELGLADKVAETAEAAVHDADLVILCVPVGAIGEVAKQIAPHLRDGAILSDVGSVKNAVIAEVEPFLPKNVHFIPAHPVAGTEESGPDAGLCDLVPQPLVHSHAAAGSRSAGGRAARCLLDGSRRQCRDHEPGAS